MCNNRNLLDLIKEVIYRYMPFSVFKWLEKRKENSQVNIIKKYYTSDCKMGKNAHMVCLKLIAGQDIPVIAQDFNVTRERIRQIIAKSSRIVAKHSHSKNTNSRAYE